MSLRIVVIGGGIAGVSAAYALAESTGSAGGGSGPEIQLVEMEGQLAHHTTGRSAAQLIVNYGTAPTRALTVAGLPFFRDPPGDLVDQPLLHDRGVLTVATADQADLVSRSLAEGRAAGAEMELLDGPETLKLWPRLRPEAVDQAVYEPRSADIDVAGLHQAFVRGIRAAGGTIETGRKVTALRPDGSGWRVDTTTGPIAADLVVNAAGAWGDVVADAAGLRPVGLEPRRRTAFMVSAPPGDPDEPLVAEMTHDWYLKRDGGQYLCSPADQTPSEPCDAKPEEVDVALAIERINAATTLDIRSVRSSWAGLRTFAPDETMVLGPDPDHPSFIWCVGQGGTGIQTAPATGRLVADLALDGRPSAYFDGLDPALDPVAFSPARFRS